MKKSFFILTIALLLGAVSFAQLTGTKNIPGDYPTIESAISALNSSGVGSGGVTFIVADGHIETFSSPIAGRITTNTGTQANPIIFQKSGSGDNPVITAATGEGEMDAIISFAGTDYVTFNGISLSEKSSNTEPVSQMEWGYALLKSSPVNGSQNITIKNCVITLNKVNESSKGIYSNNHTVSSFSQLNVSNVSGANSNLKVSGNTLANCYIGLYLSGYNHTTAPYTYYDQNCEIGVDGGNNITNIGGGSVVSYGIYTKYQNNLKVANNTVTSLTISESSAYVYGIYLTTSLNANFDLFGNYVSIDYRPTDEFGNSAFYGIYSEMGGNGTNNVANVYNNTVTNCRYPNAGGAAPAYYMYLHSLGVTANVYGNIVSNNITGSHSSLTNGPIRYLWVQKVSNIQGVVEVHDNSITGNTRLQSVPGPGTTYMLGLAGNATILNLHHNTIDENNVNTIGGANCMHVPFNDSQSKNIYNNTITNITEANGSVNGIYVSEGTMGNVYNNLIQNIKSSNTATQSTISGIYIGSYGISQYIYNNMISELSNPAAEATEGYSWNMLNGIFIDAGSTVKGIYNNTIYLNSEIKGTQTNYGSSAICSFYMYGIDLRNNILINTSASKGPNGKTVAFRARNAGLNGFTGNFNNLYAGVPGSTRLIFTDGTTNCQTLSSYKTFVSPEELQSVTEMSPFVNITASPYNLHLKTNISTQCESGGSIVSAPVEITTDFDGVPRYPNPGYPFNMFFTPNAPDIGADEFAGVPTDLIPPGVAFAPLTNTSTGTARVLTTQITDGTGVPASGTGLPRLYWKKNNGAYQGVTAVYVSDSTYTFTFGAGTVMGDVVSYYIVAQDQVNPPNIGATPWQGASGFTANPPACTTPPTTPYTYSIVQTISGVFHIGVGKTFTTLTAAVNSLNTKYMNGPVTFILDDATYPNETYPIDLLPNGGSSAVNQLIIKPNTGINAVFNTSVSGSAMFRFKGIDYVVLDGSNNGGTGRNLTFQNSASTQNSHVIGITNNGEENPSTNITVKNCIVIGNTVDVSVYTYGMVIGENMGVNGGGFDDILIQNNWIKKTLFGIDIYASANNRNHNITISSNTIGSTVISEYLMRWGIAIRQTDNAWVDKNDIMGPAEGSDAVAQCGVGYFQNSTNTRITNNKIHDFVSNFMGSVGIKCDNDNNSTPTWIVNNSIYNIGAWGLNPGVALTHAQGISVRQGGNIRIWNNSINLSGPYLYGGDSYAPSSACIALWNQSPVNSDTYDIRNNILKNSMTNTFPNPDPTAIGKAYGIMFTNSITGMVTENNDYYIDGYHGQIAQQYGVGGVFLIDYPDLAAWQAFTETDIYSVSINPQFSSDKNLLPQSVALNNLGVHIPEVTVDITGAVRSNPPDMGAYEFGTPPVVHLINIPAGWSGISSYLKPSNPDMDAVLYPIVNSLDMLNNFTGMYYPDGNIYTLETWNEYSGYAVKLSEPAQLAIGFNEITNKTVSLSQGWSFIPVLSSTAKSISSLFSGVTGFTIAKDVADGGVYWPAYGVNTIGNVQPGKAYYVKMSTSGSINYGTLGDNLSNIKTTDIESLSTPWNKVSGTPASHIVVFNTVSGLFNNGDIIGGFTPEGRCAGVQEITDSNTPFALSLNADDTYTNEKDGFTTGNQLNYKLYRPSTGETFDLAVTYDQSMNTGTFESNGASVVVTVKTVETGVVDPALVSLTIYPNPSKGIFTIDGISNSVNIKIFNAFGEEVYNNGITLPASIDLSAKGKGVYYAKIESTSGTKIEKIVIN